MGTPTKTAPSNNTSFSARSSELEPTHPARTANESKAPEVTQDQIDEFLARAYNGYNFTPEKLAAMKVKNDLEETNRKTLTTNSETKAAESSGTNRASFFSKIMQWGATSNLAAADANMEVAAQKAMNPEQQPRT